MDDRAEGLRLKCVYYRFIAMLEAVILGFHAFFLNLITMHNLQRGTEFVGTVSCVEDQSEGVNVCSLARTISTNTCACVVGAADNSKSVQLTDKTCRRDKACIRCL